MNRPHRSNVRANSGSLNRGQKRYHPVQPTSTPTVGGFQDHRWGEPPKIKPGDGSHVITDVPKPVPTYRPSQQPVPKTICDIFVQCQHRDDKRVRCTKTYEYLEGSYNTFCASCKRAREYDNKLEYETDSDSVASPRRTSPRARKSSSKRRRVDSSVNRGMAGQTVAQQSDQTPPPPPPRPVKKSVKAPAQQPKTSPTPQGSSVTQPSKRPLGATRLQIRTGKAHGLPKPTGKAHGLPKPTGNAHGLPKPTGNTHGLPIPNQKVYNTILEVMKETDFNEDPDINALKQGLLSHKEFDYRYPDKNHLEDFKKYYQKMVAGAYRPDVNQSRMKLNNVQVIDETILHLTLTVNAWDKFIFPGSGAQITGARNPG